ncbi:MAG TPA: exonuclease SbcCD subunit D [Acidimicrobiia bacterium]|nr:exonuclease SbcCD subunit D [Acidimicrobiia bacterium]
MKILHTADWHVGRTIRGRSRVEEQTEVLDEMAGIAADEAVDLVLVAGDQFDISSPPPEAERLVYRTLMQLAQVAPVVMVAGNHDHPRRLEAVAPLLELGRVTSVSTVAAPDRGGVVRPVEPARVAMIPFVSQRAIVSAADLMDLDADRQGGKYVDRMSAIIEALCQDLSADDVNVVVGHVMVHGGEVGGGERAAHTVFDYSIPSQAFPTSLSYVALGHLHRHQKLPAGAPVWYSGSPIQLDFGEEDDRKGVLLVEAEPGQPSKVDFRPLSRGRRLRTVSGTLAQVEAAAAEIPESDYVRVVLDEPVRVGIADTVREMLPQAVEVVIDPRRRKDQAGERPDRSGRSHSELLTEYLNEVDAFDEAVVKLFEDLVEEAHEA